MDDEAGVLLRAPAVLALVAARQEPAAADGEPGGDDAVDPELLTGGAHVALGRRRDDDGVVALPVVPLEPAPRVVAQVPLQVPVGEGRRAAGDLVDREAAEQAAEQLLLHLVRRRAPRRWRHAAGRGRAGSWRRSTGRSPRRLTRNGNTLPASVSVPSKSKAATVGRPDAAGPAASGSVERSATAARTSRKSCRSRQRLTAANDVAAPPGLAEGRLLLGQPPLLQRAHPVRAQAHLGERGQLVGQRHGGRSAPRRAARPG